MSKPTFKNANKRHPRICAGCKLTGRRYSNPAAIWCTACESTFVQDLEAIERGDPEVLKAIDHESADDIFARIQRNHALGVNPSTRMPNGRWTSS